MLNWLKRKKKLLSYFIMLEDLRKIKNIINVFIISFKIRIILISNVFSIYIINNLIPFINCEFK